MLRTNADALTTQAALLVVDVSQIVLDGDGTEVTLLLALAATDTTNCTGLHGCRPLVLVYTTYEYSTVLRTLLTEFDDVTWTCLYAGTTRSTLVVVNLGDSCFRINVDGIKLTCCLAVATSQTSISAGSLASTAGMHGSTST